MPTWGEILKEYNQRKGKTGHSSLDDIRKEYLIKLRQHTGRDVILYATNWTPLTNTADANVLSIIDEDMQGFMETVHGLSGTDLDIILHSPGGSAEATESIVLYLRQKFKNIRVIVPQAAMSAATMLACAGDSIVMGKQSSLGPIDPQMLIASQFGVRMTPAQSIIDEFEDAQKIAAENPNFLGAWMPILSQYSPGLVRQCHNAKTLAESLVSEWLAKWMFREEEEPSAKAKKIAGKFADHGYFQSHSRHINMKAAKDMGLKIEELESDQEFQDLVLSIFHITTITFNLAQVMKIIANHKGKAFIKTNGAAAVQKPPFRTA